ncbi:unnamed protein product [marine sediment metagenome]|uniref:Uncharacterized protein n=1 Tax=marine sediment metagenome TaxID=412755 RepID=X1E0V8_9ZZZZ
MTGENNIEKIIVETGISDLNYTEVLFGLEEGDVVVIMAVLKCSKKSPP